MKIKRFLESSNSMISLIDDYFTEITEGGKYDKEFKFEILEISKTLYKIEVSIIHPNSFDKSPITKLDYHESLNLKRYNAIKLIKSGVMGLLNDDNIEEVSVVKIDDYNIEIKIWTIDSGDDSWIFPKTVDFTDTIEIDERILKRIAKEKFNIDIRSITLEDWNYDTDNRKIRIVINGKENTNSLAKFRNYMYNMEIDHPDWSGVSIFSDMEHIWKMEMSEPYTNGYDFYVSIE